MRPKREIFIVAGIIAVLFMGSLVYAEDVIKFGCTLTISGPAANLGITQLRGVEVAVDAINSKGGITYWWETPYCKIDTIR